MSLYEIPSPASASLNTHAQAIRALMVGSGNHNAGFFVLGAGTQTVVNSSLFKSTMIAIIEPQNVAAQGAAVVLVSIVDGALTVNHNLNPVAANVGFLVFEATQY